MAHARPAPHLSPRARQRLASTLGITGLLLGLGALPLVSLLGLTGGWFSLEAWIVALIVLSVACLPVGVWVYENLPGPADNDPTFGWGGEVR